MRWLKKFKHLWSVEDQELASFEELESQTSETLEKEYQEKKNTELFQALSTLESEETKLEEPEVKLADEYDVGDVTTDDLLIETELESNYNKNIIEANLEGSDDYLIKAKKITP